MRNERNCKPGFNSCNIGADDYKEHQAAEVRAAQHAAQQVSDSRTCKPGFSSCSVDGEPRNVTPEHSKKSPGGCKHGYNSCEI